ncbi:alpha/beta hydrolase [Microvirga massiliensis]|uniref:alpha/beta hydrolase n=1 Tax=Microvirga massiliensis TaxID=1033741 RepID=UPI00062BE0B8|nr:alpha/beta hydrolase [Microvirga massiliensis]
MISTGSGLTQASLDGTTFDVYTYKPDGTINGILLVYHGTGRTAASYRDYAIELADREGLLVAAPLFDKDRFASRDYHLGGLLDGSHDLKPASQWTTRFVALLADWVRTKEASSSLPYWCWGHSAGGQFLSRVAAFEQIAAERIIVANASTHVLPLLGSYPDGEAVPYGMGGVYKGAEEQEKLRAYLAAPVTIYLGTEDDDPEDPHLTMTTEAQRQGEQRKDRGVRTFALGQSQAAALGCSFGWELVYAPEVEHSTSQMIHSPCVLRAMELFDAPVPSECCADTDNRTG